MYKGYYLMSLKGEGVAGMTPQSARPEAQAGQGPAGKGRTPACGPWPRGWWAARILPFLPLTAAIALTLHLLTGESTLTLTGESHLSVCVW